jgi:hypothetical protein
VSGRVSLHGMEMRSCTPNQGCLHASLCLCKRSSFKSIRFHSKGPYHKRDIYKLGCGSYGDTDNALFRRLYMQFSVTRGRMKLQDCMWSYSKQENAIHLFETYNASENMSRSACIIPFIPGTEEQSRVEIYLFLTAHAQRKDLCMTSSSLALAWQNTRATSQALF